MKKRWIVSFTLVELLVVIAVIAILVSILFPALKKAQVTAKRISCVSNMRQVGQAVSSYSLDYNDYYPTPCYWGFLQAISNAPATPDYLGGGGYIGVKSDYVSNFQGAGVDGPAFSEPSSSILSCPAVQLGQAKSSPAWEGGVVADVGSSVYVATQANWSDYSLSETYGGWQPGHGISWSSNAERQYFCRKANRIASNSAIVMEANYRQSIDTNCAEYGMAGNPTKPVTCTNPNYFISQYAVKNAPTPRWRPAWKNHGGMANFLFLEGHVMSIPATVVNPFYTDDGIKNWTLK